MPCPDMQLDEFFAFKVGNAIQGAVQVCIKEGVFDRFALPTFLARAYSSLANSLNPTMNVSGPRKSPLEFYEAMDLLMYCHERSLASGNKEAELAVMKVFDVLGARFKFTPKPMGRDLTEGNNPTLAASIIAMFRAAQNYADAIERGEPYTDLASSEISLVRAAELPLKIVRETDPKGGRPRASRGNNVVQLRAAGE